MSEYTNKVESEFAQIAQSSRKHTCSTAHTRNKMSLVDFNAISKGTKKFTDANFPLDDALYWKDVGEEDCKDC